MEKQSWCADCGIWVTHCGWHKQSQCHVKVAREMHMLACLLSLFELTSTFIKGVKARLIQEQKCKQHQSSSKSDSSSKE
jgi:hypothetical protein